MIRRCLRVSSVLFHMTTVSSLSPHLPHFLELGAFVYTFVFEELDSYCYSTFINQRRKQVQRGQVYAKDANC
jgi:hypothetical protein